MENEKLEHKVPTSAHRPRGSKAMLLTLIPIVGSISLGLAALYFYGVGAAGLFWSLACLAAGSLFGIVFGVPRDATKSDASV
jgi:hypothetical protein